jgi:glutamate synthase domain-containing protein 3
VRKLMARLGVRRFDDLVGRVDLLEADEAIDHWKARGVDLTNILAPPQAAPEVPRRKVRSQDPVLDDHLDHALIDLAQRALEDGEPVELGIEVQNKHRTVGGLLSGEVARRHGAEGLPDDTIVVHAQGSGGQSFGAWLAPGVTIHLDGDANDFAGKGMSGGVLAVRPPEASTFKAERNVVVGNTVLYGATSGRAFFRGLAGERFAVRNSGASAVVEGVGDHGCEYMTGGRVVVLGPTGRNFAAGMSGGIAYVLDIDRTFAQRCNPEMVELETPSAEDFEEIRELVEEHRDRTASTLATHVLAEWQALIGSWVKVMPIDYKRVLAEVAARRSTEPASVNGATAHDESEAVGAPAGDGDG